MMVVCNCCMVNKYVGCFDNSPYRYICGKCYKSEDYKKLKEEYIY